MKKVLGASRLVALAGSSLASLAILAAQPALAQTLPEAGEQADDEAEDVTEIVVTGSSIRGVPPVGSNLIGVSREDIALIGVPTTAELLATVPQLNSFNTTPRANNGGAGSFAPGLRGLPASATLPLMNGHRLVAGGANETNPDFPFLPELAIERVEIIADGASSIYGSDAVAGVVNFITRKRYSGLEASVRYGMADNYHTFSAGALAGHEWSSGSVLVAYQYSENGNVTGADRRYRSLDFRAAGGVNTQGKICPNANVLVGSTVFAAPSLAPGINNCDLNGPVDLVPASELHSVFARAEQELGSRITLWGELLYSDRKDTVQAAIPGQTVVITAANPFFRAPPGTGALAEVVFFRPDQLVGADHFDQNYRVKALNSSAGFDVQLPGAFNLSVYGTYDAAESVAFQPLINGTALAAAAAGTTTATALDPFGSGTSATVAAAIAQSSNVSVTINQRTKLAAAKIDGPLLDLPGGELKIAAGAEYRRETFQQRGFVGPTPVPEDLGRNVASVFGEIFVPIFGDDNGAPLMRRLSLSLSGRYDHYSDFGSTTNPKVGVSWDPLDGVTLRGSYGKSFRAPGLRDVGATVGSYFFDATAAAVSARDPSRGAAQVNTVYLLGGNRDLQPEKATTWSLGADIAPAFLPGLRAGVTYYNIDYTDVIGSPPFALIFTDPSFASVVFRNPNQAQLDSLLAIAVPVNLPTPLPAIGNLLDARRGNFGVRKTDGLDFDVRYNRATGFGSITAGIAGNYILNYETQLSPTAAVSNSLRLGIPRTTLRGTLGLTAGPVSAVTFINHRSGVTNNFATPTGTSVFSADGYTTVDLRLAVKLPETGFAKGFELALQVNDVFDATPPFFPATDGIGGTYNAVGRFAAVNLRKTF